jgi:hypothetical protein
MRRTELDRVHGDRGTHGHLISDSGVSADSTYRYRVREVDASGNLGLYSAVAEVITEGAPPAPNGLVEAWALDEAFGLTTADASGNGNTSMINGATWTMQGRVGNALSFNGASTVGSGLRRR